MAEWNQQMVAPTTKPHTSVVKLLNHWYIACSSAQLRTKPLARTIVGTPLVLFRDNDHKASVLLDRCAHRNVPLSLGKVESGRLQCPYHGWQYDSSGICRVIPGLCSDVENKARRVPAYPIVEQDGYVWVCPGDPTLAAPQPPRVPTPGPGRYTEARQEVFAEASVHATIENALDVPHTAFLHAGLFRGAGTKNNIDVVVTRYADRVEAAYIGEPRPSGLVGKILSPQGGTVEHTDRFILPSIAQVEYRLGERAHFLVTSYCTPETDFSTRMFAIIQFRLPLPGWMILPFLKPIALRIFGQDARILKEQSRVINYFGGEQYVSTEIDFLGNQIWRLMKAAERNEPGTRDGTEVEQRVRLFI